MSLSYPKRIPNQSSAKSKEKASYFKGVLGVTFSNEDLLLRTTKNTTIDSVYIDVENFKLSRVLVDLIWMHRSTL